jgi:hypothetical protein
MARAAALALSGVLVSGCAVAQFGSMFGGSKQDVTGAIDSSTAPQARSLSLAAADVGATPAALDMTDSSCPRVEARDEASQLTIYEIGRVGDSLAIKHRGEITKTARECEIAPNQVTVKYGVAGRVLLGPLGQPGTVKLPTLVNVVDKAKQSIKSERLMVAVTIDADKPYGNFSEVERVTFPLPQGALPGDYNVFVSFDKKTAGAG